MSDHKKDCEPPFWNDISIIFKDFNLQYIPSCEHSLLNFIARLLILSVFVGMIASVVGGLSALLVTMLFGGITAFVIIMTTPSINKKIHMDFNKITSSMTSPIKKKWDTYHTLPYVANVDPSGYIAPIKEHFVNGGSAVGSVQPIGMEEIDASPYSGPSLPDYTPPTSRNLFMNILVDEMKYNPDRPQAAPVDNPAVKQTMDDYFRVQWFSDPTDVFGKNQGQRQFITQPSTTVPNDQGSFANWLYKIPGKTCKEGGRIACQSSTDGGPLVWLNQDS